MENTKKIKKISIVKIIFYAIAIFYAFICLAPFIWTLITSFKPASETAKMSVDFSKLTFENYTYIWSKFPFLRWFLNSVIVAFIVTAGNMIINSMAGYALARMEFPGKKIIFYVILAMMMVPGQVVMVPTYMLLSKLGWVDSYQGLTIPFLYSLFNIFLMRQFFLNIPKSLEEAALIDGMGRFKIFWKIAMPLAKPALSTQFILTFAGNWNSFMWPSLLASTSEHYTLPVGLNSFYGQYYSLWNQVTAGVMILTIPTIIFFLIFQKNFVKGIATSGMKE
ncbi:carbohydrate ABC transporter membrane protein 2, CUT1 family [Clostridium sp. USBA 49]|jgi:multiple sugar transport system permease protein|uniref:carbohydrate ABC transporter permease n=1 Tax=Clostridium TaxID=1485 RepID=UPI0009D1B408|nr:MULTISPECIES: carbohydrate ABC transporter permease [Clostridium]SKA78140.1 carbohydrate ABC transporter membrane protein 2, CUT1 family [Clostridium sp. USBA 49]